MGDFCIIYDCACVVYPKSHVTDVGKAEEIIRENVLYNEQGLSDYLNLMYYGMYDLCSKEYLAKI